MSDEMCGELGVFRRYWPGEEPDIVCVEHAEDSRKIANAMGFPLVMEPIGYGVSDPVPAEFPECACHKGHPQEIHTGQPALEE